MAKIGRPRALESPEKAWELGQAYFKQCEADKEPLTVTGLALALGLPARQSLCEYQAREEFTDVIKRLKAVVEHSYERLAIDNRNPAGPIFVLKNMGWSDKQEHTLSGPDGNAIKLDGRFEIVLCKPVTSASTPDNTPNSTKTK